MHAHGPGGDGFRRPRFSTRIGAALWQLLSGRRTLVFDAEAEAAAAGPGMAQAEDAPARSAAYAVAEPVPEHVHHAKFSADELDAMIEDSLRCGTADFYAASRPAVEDEAEDTSAPPVRSRAPRRGAAPVPAPTEARSFGGDLYPTAAHRVGRHVRSVRVSTWAAERPAPSEPQRPGGH